MFEEVLAGNMLRHNDKSINIRACDHRGYVSYQTSGLHSVLILTRTKDPKTITTKGENLSPCFIDDCRRKAFPNTHMPDEFDGDFLDRTKYGGPGNDKSG